MLVNLLQIAAEAGASAAAVPQQEVVSYSLLEMAAKGGWLMLVLLALSIIAIYVFGKKWWILRNACILDRNFMKNIHEYLHEGKMMSALSLCRKESSPIARIIERGIAKVDRPLQDIQATMENTGNVEVAKLERGLPMLATIAGGAPMIGFLGTVMGMIQAFFNMANAGNNIDITLLSGGIYTAMVTTVGGLIVGILAYFGYNFLTSRVSDVVYLMDSATADFLDMLHDETDMENLFESGCGQDTDQE